MNLYKSLLILIFLLFQIENLFAATVDVAVDNFAVEVNDVFEVSIRADIRSPVLGWGLDISYDDQVLSLQDNVIGLNWVSASSLDGDNLVGLAFPLPVSGQEIILSTLTFQAISVGNSELFLSITQGDLTEGFPSLAGFADFNLNSGTVQVSAVPLPASLLLLLSSLVYLTRFNRK